MQLQNVCQPTMLVWCLLDFELLAHSTVPALTGHGCMGRGATTVHPMHNQSTNQYPLSQLSGRGSPCSSNDPVSCSGMHAPTL